MGHKVIGYDAEGHKIWSENVRADVSYHSGPVRGGPIDPPAKPLDLQVPYRSTNPHKRVPLRIKRDAA